jgi:hypothetical protein
MRRFTVALLSLALLRSAGAQSPPPKSSHALVRLESGSLNPDDPFTVTLAYGAQVGWQFGPHGLLLRATWQELSRDLYSYTAPENGRRYVSLVYERHLGWDEPFHQQVVLRAEAGGVARRPWKTAAFGSLGLGLRYPVSPRIAFLGSIEDRMVGLPKDTLPDCGYDPCPAYTVGGKLQHNFGMFISVELRP